MKRLSDVAKNPMTVLVVLCVVSILLGLNIRGGSEGRYRVYGAKGRPVIQDLIETVEEFGLRT